ncbi:3-deoxy-7-phosphoheptulonate synthase [Streptomyces malaysiensis subsp. malaysiensis]|uniref:3-deoxy-7-phosphoheptulonate synthase n=1 Tax=Streptomyces malaysiensis TaxID=92644 RepID=UPI000BFC0655|nr:3-deoxy-7-phosphoheptulonate synthase [Streptomyces malaysiensis]ATL81850.1 phospho-2-dehydro-3-deoxyheptonate aldolase [Streptomyces malaysiensis]QDL73749.1 3-deoxy-7-phosphoheptulonate synthase [Streptomyces malaysiensis]
MTAPGPTAEKVTAQQPPWPDPDRLDKIRHALGERPPLIPPEETGELARRLAAVQRGEAVVLQGGDCAELFADATPPVVRRKLGQLRELSAAIRTGLGLPVVTMGRIAGQYAKPRSAPYEWLADGTRLPVYRGDAVNGAAADPDARIPDPDRLLTAYDRAADVLSTMRNEQTAHDPAERIFASHELLLLPYESPLIRPADGGRYASSLHFGWIGERTRDPQGPHIRLAASIRNPVGVKAGPSATPADLVELVRLLNPGRRPGRLTFIVRMGADRIDWLLPPLVEAVAETGIPVVWLSDPLHGNTIRSGSGHKTRSLRAILDEAAAFHRILRDRGQWPGGLHLEMTPEPVTECVARAADAGTAAFPRFRSPCDPRLNPEQAAETVHAFTSMLRAG